jgi:hypothetical protein
VDIIDEYDQVHPQQRKRELEKSRTIHTIEENFENTEETQKITFNGWFRSIPEENQNCDAECSSFNPMLSK